MKRFFKLNTNNAFISSKKFFLYPQFYHKFNHIQYFLYNKNIKIILKIYK